MDMDSTEMDMDMSGVPVVPAGVAYADGQDIRFIHTEVSDPEIGKLLTEMMDLPCWWSLPWRRRQRQCWRKYTYSPTAAKAWVRWASSRMYSITPPAVRATARYAPFSSSPGRMKAKPRELKSAAEVAEAESAGEVTLEQPGVVVNMPFITWPGGER